MTVVKRINKDTTLCATDDERLYVAKRERLDDPEVVQHRLDLVDALRRDSFPCPAFIEIEGKRFLEAEGDYILFQEYVDFSSVDQGDWYRERKLEDSSKLLTWFQEIGADLRHPEFERWFRPLFEEYVTRRRGQLPTDDGGYAGRVVAWTEEQIDALDGLPKVPCHGSFRHHNLFYDPSEKLYLVDFFHGIYYAPRIYDLCVLMSIFAYGVQLANAGQTLRNLLADRVVLSLWAALKWGTYRSRQVERLVTTFGPTETERELLIPCYYLAFLRNESFGRMVSSVQFRTFIRLLAKVLRTDRHPLDL